MKWTTGIKTDDEELLYLSPALMVLLEINSIGTLAREDKKKLFRLSFLKGYTPHPLLRSYYTQVQAGFKDQLMKLDKIFPKDKKDRELLVRGRLKKVIGLLQRKNKHYAFLFSRSLVSFREHAARILRTQKPEPLRLAA